MNSKKYLKHILFCLIISFSGATSFASNMKETYVKQLKEIKKIKGNGDNKQLTLVGQTADELTKDWSPELAKELARVFNELLDVNGNYFLVELIEPLIKKRKDEFMPILNKALSEKNKKLYKELKEISEREAREGNG